MKWLDGITDAMDMGLGGSGSWWWAGGPGMQQSVGPQSLGGLRKLMVGRGPVMLQSVGSQSQTRLK